MLLTALNIKKNYGTKQLLNDISLFIDRGNKLGVIGINGTGKSTLLRILAGVEEEDSGEVNVYPNVKRAYLAQNPTFGSAKTVLEASMNGLSAEFREENEHEAKAMLQRFALDDYYKNIEDLSGGQKKRLALVRALIEPSDVLILDEPTNHLDTDMIIWLENYLSRFKGGLIMITHDRFFLERVSNRIIELDDGKIYSYEANYSKYLELKNEREEMALASERKRQAVLRREYQWIMRGARARSTKSTERIERYENLKAQPKLKAAENVEIGSAAFSRLGRKTIELSDVSKSYNGVCLFDGFSYGLLKDDRIGIVGKNGAGKTTLMGIMAGRLAPDSGSVQMGETVKIGYFEQNSESLPDDKRVFDVVFEVSHSLRTKEGEITAAQMLEKFLFPSYMQSMTVGSLSGGERRRLFLLTILMSAPNILLLDEPTNDLDVETLAILEDYLMDFPGAVIAVSHDRWFLDKIATQIFEVADGRVNKFIGGFSDYYPQRTETKVKNEKKEKTEKYHSQREKKLKFTFNEQKEFETIDKDIEKLENTLKEVENEISLKTSDYQALQELTEKREKLISELDEKTERWVYLNELAEKIEMQKNNY